MPGLMAVMVMNRVVRGVLQVQVPMVMTAAMATKAQQVLRCGSNCLVISRTSRSRCWLRVVPAASLVRPVARVSGVNPKAVLFIAQTRANRDAQAKPGNPVKQADQVQ